MCEYVYLCPVGAGQSEPRRITSFNVFIKKLPLTEKSKNYFLSLHRREVNRPAAYSNTGVYNAIPGSLVKQSFIQPERGAVKE